MAYKDKKGRYRKNIYVGVDDEGKYKYQTIYAKSPDALNEQEFQLRAQLHKHYDLLSDDSFAVWVDAYLSSVKPDLSDAEYKLQTARTGFFVSRLGNKSMSKILPVELQRLINELYECNPHTGKPSSKRTINGYKQLLARVFDYAVDNRIIDYNPAKRLTVPRKAEVSTRRALTPEERRRIVEFEHRAQPAMMIMLFAGLRRGEVAALKWTDIDLDAQTIRVSRSYDYKNNAFKPPKNGKSRTVVIPVKLVDYLKKLPHTSSYVVVSAKGQMLTATGWKRMLETYLKDMNIKYAYGGSVSKCRPGGVPMLIEPFTYHCLRHTFCTMMYEAGVDVLVAQEQMGHSDVKTTLSIYTHLSNEHAKRDIEKFNTFCADL